MNSNGNALATRNQMAETIEQRREKIVAALPAMVDKHRFMEIAINLVRSNTDLQKCNPASVALAVYGCARLGLTPDPVLGHVHIVPFKNVATVVPGYQGLVELARRSGKLKTVHCELVRDGEHFRYWVDENGPHIEHEPGLDTDANVIAAYCIARFADGSYQIERMSRKQIDKRNTNAPPWRQWWDEQAKKTVLKRASKTWPLSPEAAYAVRLDEEAEQGKVQSISPQMDDVRHPPAADAGDDPILAEVVGEDEGASNIDPITDDDLIDAGVLRE